MKASEEIKQYIASLKVGDLVQVNVHPWSNIYYSRIKQINNDGSLIISNGRIIDFHLNDTECYGTMVYLSISPINERLKLYRIIDKYFNCDLSLDELKEVRKIFVRAKLRKRINKQNKGAD
jgi:hypothetical protein